MGFFPLLHNPFISHVSDFHTPGSKLAAEFDSEWNNQEGIKGNMVQLVQRI